MNSRINKCDIVIRQILLISLLFMIYAGPAAVFGLKRFLDEETFGESTPGEWTPFVLVIWLFAVPLGLAYANWEDSPDKSVSWLAIFLAAIFLPFLVGIPIVHAASALVVLPALSLPFGWFDISGPRDDVAFWISRVCTFVILIGIPLGALLFQIIQWKHNLKTR